MENKNYDRAGVEKDRQRNNLAKFETERMKGEQKAAQSNDKKV